MELVITLGATALALVLGTTLGLIGGFYGRLASTLTMRTVDVVLAFPPVVLALLVVTINGPGELTLIVGESGSGKRTIGKAISGLVGVSAGSFTINGQDVGAMRGRAARRVSVVFQDPASSLNPRATIGASISEPLRRHGIVRTRGEGRERARALLDQVRLPADWVDRYPHELFGGQRQRVGIARAISTRPRILIADEPASALDASVQAEVLGLFRELQSELSFACLFISHDLAVVEMLANHVVVLRHGSVVEEGPTGAVLGDAQENYTRDLIAAAPVPDPVEQKRRRAR